MTLLEQIKARMAKYCVSHEELAQAIGVHRVQVTRYFSGARSPNVHIVEAMAKALECDIRLVNHARKE